ncbi:MAG: tetratricopeptide repeat protein, partial [Rhodospirillaceae bacterium]|nr:tetratricopeptide repeat protein [Rhodospirillaceae bacterium]
MSLADGFFATDLFHLPTTPGVASAWRRLQLGDTEGAAFFADGLTEAEVGIVGLAQTRAAVSVAVGDAVAASQTLRAVLPRLSSPDEVAAISFQYGLCAQACGDFVGAREAFERAAALAPQRAANIVALALLIWDKDGADAGRAAFHRAVMSPDIWAAWARRERADGDEAAACRVVDAALTHYPDHPDLLNILVASHLSTRQFSAALAILERMPKDSAVHPFVQINRGSALLGARRFAEARVCFAQGLEQIPDAFAARYGLAVADFEIGNDAEAEAEFREALALRPFHPEATVYVSRLLMRRCRTDEAEQILQALLQETPDCFSAQYQLAVILRESGDLEGAENHLRKAQDLRPDAVYLHDLLGLLRLGQGDMDGARRSFDLAVTAFSVDAAGYASNRLYAQHYDPHVDPADMFAAHQDYGVRFGGVGEDTDWRFANVPDPERRLRVGYISPDFRAHSVAFFMTAPVDRHDRARFEVFAYSNAPYDDEATRWFSESVDVWREARGLSFDELRAQIRADGIDVLVDLAGHTGNNALPMFARRAAPVQVTYLGYPDTTGVPAMDARLVDAVSDPPGVADTLASERLIRLPCPFVCYRPTADAPPVAAGPFVDGAPMTFGSFNTAMKLNDPLFDAWAAILHAVPDSRLLLKAKPFSSPTARAWVQEALGSRGIVADRLTIMAFAPTLGAHLDLYGEIDLALDTFPYNGTTTTCEAL